MSKESNRQQDILGAALAEFAAKGFQGATIKSIAQAAQLQSPSLIYWYFETKEALFQAVITEHLSLFQTVLDPAPLLDRPPEEVLPLLAQGYLEIPDHPATRNLVRLILAEVARYPKLAEMVSHNLSQPILNFLKSYLTRQIELGHLRPHDVRAGARAFVGLFIPQVVGVILFPAIGADGLAGEEYLNTAVDIFLRGLQPVK